TELSGRGVGLSTVKTTAERLHGSYSIDSTPGEGTRIEMRLPLSLAVVSCFLVDVGERRYGIPINSIQRTLDLREVNVKTMEGRDVFVSQEDDMIPLIRLHEVLEVDADEPDDATIIVVENGNQRAGFLVDEVADVQDFVSKDLDLLEVKGVGGTSILSDGTPVIILDVNDMIGE
ncbi:MAG: chemotaxis protein CheW, partial [Candidatus Nanohaloarchaea archaeon]|nr:chemotaxis protein CheW [Candidatus Nanohaloarchaea archaeon]